MRRCGLEKRQTLDADVVVIVADTGSELVTLPMALEDRVFSSAALGLLVQQARVEALKFLHPVPEAAALEAHLTAHRLVVGDCPAKTNSIKTFVAFA